MKKLLVFGFIMILLASCSSAESELVPTPETTDESQVNLPNPASVYCEDQGYTLEIRTADDGSQSGFCIFPDGSECEEWAFYRDECDFAKQDDSNVSPLAIRTAVPIDPNDYQGWWTYTNPEYGFSIMLPEVWKLEEITANDPLMNGHMLNLYTEGYNIRMAFRQVGEDVLLWPTGVGAGEFVEQGTLDVAGQPASRFYFVCPNGEINYIWYHGNENEPNIHRGDLEFSFILSFTDYYCEEGHSIDGKVQHVAEMIIASLQVP